MLNPDTINSILADGKKVDPMPENQDLEMMKDQCKRYEIYVRLDMLHIVKELTTDEKTINEIKRLIYNLRNELQNS